MSLEASIFAAAMLHEELEGRTGETDRETDRKADEDPFACCINYIYPSDNAVLNSN